METSPVLVVGATGSLGGRVVKSLLGRNHRVRALVREGSDPGILKALGVEIVTGNLRNPLSLAHALDGVGVLITTANGLTGRRRGDSLSTIDDVGNRNLIDAAREAKLRRFIFTSILGCDLAFDVPHFWQKKLIEDALERSGVPFVALRPGALVSPPSPGQSDFWSRELKKHRFTAPGSAHIPWSWIHIDDVADRLARAVDEPRALGRKIDLAAQPAASGEQLAALFSKLLEVPIRVRTLPFWRATAFQPELRTTLKHFLAGNYVADTTVQAELFGPVPTLRDTLQRYLDSIGLGEGARVAA